MYIISFDTAQCVPGSSLSQAQLCQGTTGNRTGLVLNNRHGTTSFLNVVSIAGVTSYYCCIVCNVLRNDVAHGLYVFCSYSRS